MFVAADAFRRGIEQSQPLLVRRTFTSTPVPSTLFNLSVPGVMVTSVKRSIDGKAVIVRLFNISGRPETFRIAWREMKPAKVYRSSVFETRDAEAGETLGLPAFGILTLRCER
jgi:alpha-mannosidase